MAERGINVTLFDKARGPGGRMASKRRPSATLDLGAQTFTARDARFLQLIESLKNQGVVARWPGVSFEAGNAGWTRLDDDQRRYTGAPRMSAITRELANRLTRFKHVKTHFDTRVQALTKPGDGQHGWALCADHHQPLGTFDTVVITAPPPQAEALIGEWDPVLAQACSARAQRSCWAGYVVFKTPLPPIDSVIHWESLHARHAALRLVSRNHTKPGREHQPESLSLLAQLDWSEQMLERPAGEVACALYAAFRSLLPRDIELPDIVELGAHRWRYAQANAPGHESYLYSEQGLALCGESFRGSRVEDAWLSGRELGNALAELPESYRNQTSV
ncbi:FAD-dependent oxidoreductase [Halomonas sp. PAMB 3264]|uniref:NAD(P)/FAD-dependent oxidoreductase n=1 Tax=Halomonas sp. PAMB 3264 TaxID=3075222 RepID=UPI00289979FF|nr:FAD-dependent oxidoreductase [Halomonas sp. PAMB 3264]WNL43978.1 FAD-dependent oxidoreductase [Halomonas sp. PAMB 3264]